MGDNFGMDKLEMLLFRVRALVDSGRAQVGPAYSVPNWQFDKLREALDRYDREEADGSDTGAAIHAGDTRDAHV